MEDPVPHPEVTEAVEAAAMAFALQPRFDDIIELLTDVNPDEANGVISAAERALARLRDDLAKENLRQVVESNRSAAMTPKMTAERMPQMNESSTHSQPPLGDPT